jgi:hypothetical protein
MIDRPRYLIKLVNAGSEIDRIETSMPRVMHAEVIRQKLRKDWAFLNPGDTIVLIDTHEE